MKNLIVFLLAFCLIIPATLVGQSTNKLPADRAGEITTPSGKIAFIRDKNLWVMDWDGKNQFKVVTAENATGKPSWAPDGKKIAFTREGLVDVQGPDHLGGRHKIYDIFLGYPDSAASTTNWWYRLTDDYGSRFPEFSRDGSRIFFTKDLNANTVNALLPNYQTCLMGPEGEDFEIIRKDFNTGSEYQCTMPTMGTGGKYASVLTKGVDKIGVMIAPLTMTALTDATIKKNARVMPSTTAPAWSPDGKWVAFINTDLNKQGIYITGPDLKEQFLVYKVSIGQTLQTFPLSWSPDSKWIVFALNDGSFWIVDITGNGLRQISGPGMNIAPSWSR